jgi:hypothetical protein
VWATGQQAIHPARSGYHPAWLGADPRPKGHDAIYSGQHRFYCGVDLYTRTLAPCVFDAAGTIALEATVPPEPDRLLASLALYRDGLVVGCECLLA